MQVKLHPRIVLPEEVGSLGHEVGPGHLSNRVLARRRRRQQKSEGEGGRKGHASWVSADRPIRHLIWALSLVLAPVFARAEELPTGPEEPLRLLRDGEKPGWGLEGRERAAFLKLLDEGRFEPGVVTAMPRELMERADWETRLQVPLNPLSLDGLGYFDRFRTLWQTDGTRLGTHAVAELPYYQFVNNGGGARLFARLGDGLFIVARTEPQDAVLLRWDGQSLRELRRWTDPSSSARPSGLSVAGGYLWFGMSSDEGDWLYRVGPKGEIRAVRNLNDSCAFCDRGEDFGAVRALGERLFAFEELTVTEIFDPASEEPRFVRVTGASQTRTEGKRAALDNSLWFIGNDGLRQIDSEREGRAVLVLAGTIDRDYRPVRRDRVLVEGRLLDGGGQLVADLGPSIAGRGVVSRIQDDGIFWVRPVHEAGGDPTLLRQEAVRADLETGREEALVESSTSSVQLRWVDTGQQLFLETHAVNAALSYRRWNGSGLDAPIVLEARRQSGRESRLTGLVGSEGLVTTSFSGQDVAWIERRSGALVLTARAQFGGSVGDDTVLLAGDEIAISVFRFDPERSPEPERIRSFVGDEGALLGRIEDQLVLQLGPSFQAQIFALDVVDGDVHFVSSNDPRLLPYFEPVTLSARGLWLRGTSEGRTTLARWRPELAEPETLRVYPEEFNVSLIPVGESAWGTEFSRSTGAWERRFHALLSPGFDPERPALVLSAGDLELDERIFTVVRSDAFPRALVQVQTQLVHLDPEEARRVEGLPEDIELQEAILTEWGAYVLAQDLEYGLEPYRLVRPELGGPVERIDIAVGPAGSNPADFTPAFGGHVFLADDGVHGRELWFDDGEAARMVCDFVPGPMSGAETFGVLADDEGVFLRVDTGERGRALWRVRREVVLGQRPCPELHVLTPNVLGAPDDPRAGALMAKDGGCSSGRSGVPAVLLLMGLWAVRRKLSGQA